jgi:hypothetical protein
MAGVESASLSTPGETRTFARGKVELVTVAGSTVGRFTFEPGWRWSESVKPIVKTESCQSHHVGYAVSGRMRIRSADGVESEIKAADAYDIAPGHDAWIVGDEVFVGLEFKSAAEYARPK